MIAADDGEFHPGLFVTMSKNNEDFPGAPVHIYSDANLRAVTYAVAAHFLRKAVLESLDKSRNSGIRSGSYLSALQSSYYTLFRRAGSSFHETNSVRV